MGLIVTMKCLSVNGKRYFWRNILMYSVEYTVVLLQILLTGNISGFSLRPPDGETTPVPTILNHNGDNVTAIVGGRAILECKVANLGTKTVVWRKADRKDPITVGTLTYNPDKRFQVRNIPHLDEWNLIIKDVKKKDAGVYECQISSKDRSIREQVYLTVQDIKQDEYVDSYNSGTGWLMSLYNTELPYTTVSSSPAGFDFSRLLSKGISISNTTYVEKGDRIILECNATSDDVDWFKKGRKVLTNDAKGINIMKKVYLKRRMIKSTLEINKASMEDDTDFVCRASDMQSSYVKVHVLNDETQRDKRYHKQYSNGTGPSHSGIRGFIHSKIYIFIYTLATYTVIQWFICR